MADVTINAKQVRPLLGCVTDMKVMAEDAYIGDWIYLNASGYAALTDADDAAKCTGNIGQIVAGQRHDANGVVKSGETVTIVWFGPVYEGEDAALDETAVYYLSATAGDIADAAGTVTRRVGSPLSSTVLFINANTVMPTS